MPRIAGVAKQASKQEDIVSNLATTARAVFEGMPGASLGSLQNELDCLTAKVVRVTFETFREEFDNLIQLLRNAYGQVARFAEEDFRQDASFYLGQLHALAEITHRLGNQRAPREALEAVARSQIAKRILSKTAQEKSIGARDLAKELGMEESNLSAVCEFLVKKELLRRDRFGKRARYSPTPLTFAVLAGLSVQEFQESDDHKPASALPHSMNTPPRAANSGDIAATARRFRQDVSCQEVPGRCQHVGGRELRTTVPALHQLHGAVHGQHENRGDDRWERALPLCCVQRCFEDEERGRDRNQPRNNEA